MDPPRLPESSWPAHPDESARSGVAKPLAPGRSRHPTITANVSGFGRSTRPIAVSISVTRRSLLAGAGRHHALLVGRAARSCARKAQPLKVGVLLPRSGAQAGIGQDCQRGVDIAAGDLQGPRPAAISQIMNADTETNVEVARARAEKLINDGAQLLVGAFDSGQTHGDRPGRRAEGHPVRHQHRGGAADHRAGLQVRVPQLPDRADDPRRRLRQPEGGVRDHRQGAEDGGVHARQRHLRHGDAAAASAPCCRSSTCPTRSPRRSPTIRRRAISRSRWRRPRRPAPRRCSWSAASTTRS